MKVSIKSNLTLSFTPSLNQVSIVKSSSMTKTKPRVLKTVKDRSSAGSSHKVRSREGLYEASFTSALCNAERLCRTQDLLAQVE
uniref:Uncharacterized protein n=1 Tax=Arundo donax TaxID=35708 RepID=A0A0A9B635_ARUDO